MPRRSLRAIAVAAVAWPAPAEAHDGAPLAPHDLWSAWTADPWVLVPLLLVAAVYARGLSGLWRVSGQGRGIRTREAASFAFGWLLLALSLLSPLHALGEVLFSAHMVQHELMMVVAAPLLVLGRPVVAFAWATPARARRPVTTVLRRPVLRGTWHWIATPLVAWTAHAVAIWAWHLPALYVRTVDEPLFHAMQHLSFVTTGLLFWWALLRGPRMGAGAAIAYLFTTMLHTGALGVLLTVASGLWYPVYSTTTVAWGLSPMEDQQLGGLIMWIPGSITYIVAALVLLARWMRDSETRVRLAERPVPALRRAGLALVLVLAAAACDSHDDRLPAIAGGDADRGRERIRAYGCGSCHSIPGVSGATALVGPPLTGIARRVYIGGVVTNTPGNMISWIQNPRALAPKTAMPNLGVGYDDAVDIASYLYTRR